MLLLLLSFFAVVVKSFFHLFSSNLNTFLQSKHVLHVYLGNNEKGYHTTKEFPSPINQSRSKCQRLRAVNRSESEETATRLVANIGKIKSTCSSERTRRGHQDLGCKGVLQEDTEVTVHADVEWKKKNIASDITIVYLGLLQFTCPVAHVIFLSCFVRGWFSVAIHLSVVTSATLKRSSKVAISRTTNNSPFKYKLPPPRHHTPPNAIPSPGTLYIAR